MQFFLRWDGFADAAELLLNALDLIPRNFALLRVQVCGGGPRQTSLGAVHDRGDHLQVT
jgi:hypothetical protein